LEVTTRERDHLSEQLTRRQEENVQLEQVIAEREEFETKTAMIAQEKAELELKVENALQQLEQANEELLKTKQVRCIVTATKCYIDERFVLGTRYCCQ
jgi:TATA-binding protein-associated factor Taf7